MLAHFNAWIIAFDFCISHSTAFIIGSLRLRTYAG